MVAFSFDVVGSVGGFYATLEKTLAATNQNWQDAPTGSPQITGVNHLLNAVDDTNDFWPNGLVVHDDGTGTAIHTAKAVPSRRPPCCSRWESSWASRPRPLHP